jgi:hypothetical protein
MAVSVDWSTNIGASAWIGAALVDGLADHVHDAPQSHRADGHADLAARIHHRLAAGEAVGRVHRDSANRVLAEMLGDLEHEAVAVIVGFERREDLGQVAVERHVDDGADHLGDAADIVGGGGGAAALHRHDFRLKHLFFLHHFFRAEETSSLAISHTPARASK